jgi:hypothetical protein
MESAFYYVPSMQSYVRPLRTNLLAVVTYFQRRKIRLDCQVREEDLQSNLFAVFSIDRPSHFDRSRWSFIKAGISITMCFLDCSLVDYVLSHTAQAVILHPRDTSINNIKMECRGKLQDIVLKAEATATALFVCQFLVINKAFCILVQNTDRIEYE